MAVNRYTSESSRKVVPDMSPEAVPLYQPTVPEPDLDAIRETAGLVMNEMDTTYENLMDRPDMEEGYKEWYENEFGVPLAQDMQKASDYYQRGENGKGMAQLKRIQRQVYRAKQPGGAYYEAARIKEELDERRQEIRNFYLNPDKPDTYDADVGEYELEKLDSESAKPPGDLSELRNKKIERPNLTRIYDDNAIIDNMVATIGNAKLNIDTELQSFLNEHPEIELPENARVLDFLMAIKDENLTRPRVRRILLNAMPREYLESIKKQAEVYGFEAGDDWYDPTKGEWNLDNRIGQIMRSIEDIMVTGQRTIDLTAISSMTPTSQDRRNPTGTKDKPPKNKKKPTVQYNKATSRTAVIKGRPQTESTTNDEGEFVDPSTRQGAQDYTSLLYDRFDRYHTETESTLQNTFTALFPEITDGNIASLTIGKLMEVSGWNDMNVADPPDRIDEYLMSRLDAAGGIKLITDIVRNAEGNENISDPELAQKANALYWQFRDWVMKFQDYNAKIQALYPNHLNAQINNDPTLKGLVNPWDDTGLLDESRIVQSQWWLTNYPAFVEILENARYAETWLNPNDWLDVVGRRVNKFLQNEYGPSVTYEDIPGLEQLIKPSYNLAENIDLSLPDVIADFVRDLPTEDEAIREFPQITSAEGSRGKRDQGRGRRAETGGPKPSATKKGDARQFQIVDPDDLEDANEVVERLRVYIRDMNLDAKHPLVKAVDEYEARLEVEVDEGEVTRALLNIAKSKINNAVEFSQNEVRRQSKPQDRASKDLLAEATTAVEQSDENYRYNHFNFLGPTETSKSNWVNNYKLDPKTATAAQTYQFNTSETLNIVADANEGKLRESVGSHIQTVNNTKIWRIEERGVDDKDFLLVTKPDDESLIKAEDKARFDKGELKGGIAGIEMTSLVITNDGKVMGYGYTQSISDEGGFDPTRREPVLFEYGDMTQELFEALKKDGQEGGFRMQGMIDQMLDNDEIVNYDKNPNLANTTTTYLFGGEPIRVTRQRTGNQQNAFTYKLWYNGRMVPNGVDDTNVFSRAQLINVWTKMFSAQGSIPGTVETRDAFDIDENGRFKFKPGDSNASWKNQTNKSWGSRVNNPLNFVFRVDADDEVELEAQANVFAKWFEEYGLYVKPTATKIGSIGSEDKDDYGIDLSDSRNSIPDILQASMAYIDDSRGGFFVNRDDGTTSQRWAYIDENFRPDLPIGAIYWDDEAKTDYETSKRGRWMININQSVWNRLSRHAKLFIMARMEQLEGGGKGGILGRFIENYEDDEGLLAPKP